MHDVDLVPFTEVSVTDSLGRRLAQLVELIRERLQVDLPQVLPRYATPEAAMASIRQVQRRMHQKSDLAAYFIRVNGEIVGVVSCQQSQLRTRRHLFGLIKGGLVAEGPLIAGWHGSENEQPVMAQVLSQLWLKLSQNEAMQGRPWTLVRVGHAVVERGLANRRNGFDGFESLGVGNYAYVDGVQELRRLYVARQFL